MENKLEKIIDLYRRNNFKITPQRRVIFEQLVDDHSHPSADNIYQRVSMIMPDISRSTVYNTIHELVELGELAPVSEIEEGCIRYDTNLDDHHHLLCVGCGALVDIASDFVTLNVEEKHTAGYMILKNQVTIYGYCPSCQNK